MHNLPYVAWTVLNWTASDRLVMQISIYYVHKVDVQRRDSIFAPCPQTYATAGNMAMAQLELHSRPGCCGSGLGTWRWHSCIVGQAAVAQAWEHGDGRGGMATQLARSPQQSFGLSK